MSKVSARWVSQQLTKDQIEQQKNIMAVLIIMKKKKDFLIFIVTGDEMWVRYA